MKIIQNVAALSALALVAACGGQPAGEPDAPPVMSSAVGAPSESSESSAAPEAQPEGEGMPSWTAADGPVAIECADEQTATAFTVNLPTDESHEGVQMIEEVRKSVGVTEKPHYVVVEADATKAVDKPVRIEGMEWATVEFATGKAVEAEAIFDEWADSSNVEAYNRIVDLTNALLETGPARGAKGYHVLIADQPIESVVAPSLTTDYYTSLFCEFRQ